MLISIETHRTYDFPGGGGELYCICEHQSFGLNIASVAKWVLGLFLEADLLISSTHYELFLKIYCLLRKKIHTGVRDVNRAFKNRLLNWFPPL